MSHWNSSHWVVQKNLYQVPIPYIVLQHIPSRFFTLNYLFVPSQHAQWHATDTHISINAMNIHSDGLHVALTLLETFWVGKNHVYSNKVLGTQRHFLRPKRNPGPRTVWRYPGCANWRQSHRMVPGPILLSNVVTASISLLFICKIKEISFSYLAIVLWGSIQGRCNQRNLISLQLK